MALSPLAESDEQPSWSQVLAAQRAALHIERPGQFLRAHSDVVDRLLRMTWRTAGMPKGSALAAVGGYGRRELYPASDVDLLVLLSRELEESEKEGLEAWVANLWDAGVVIGHSVRTAAQCLSAAQEDITIQTNLLEGRCVAGSHRAWRALTVALYGQLNRQQFVTRKLQEQAAREGKYQSSTSTHEPNCKESPGGLRDAHLMSWLALAYGLEKQGTALRNAQEQRAYTRCLTFLRRVRIGLHLLTGRREDRLLFEHQNALAARLGFHGGAGRNGQDDHRVAQQLMKTYYRSAKTMHRLNNLFIVLLMQRQRSIETVTGAPDLLPAEGSDYFFIEERRLTVCDPQVFIKHPEAILHGFALLQKLEHLEGFSVDAQRLLWAAGSLIDAEFRHNQRHRQQFLALLMTGRRVGLTLQRMHDYDILGAYLPLFGKIIGQMQYDLFHVYTVDQHTLNVLHNLHEFTTPHAEQDFPLAAKLMTIHRRVGCLYIAALFHDIAKGRGGDHSQLGAKDAERFCREHDVSQSDRDLICGLVLHHLEMSRVAEKENLEDPAVIRRFAKLVRDEEFLNSLYLLTVADIRATAPKLWTSWKSRLLEALYLAALQALRGKGQMVDDVALRLRREDVQERLRYHRIEPGREAAVWSLFDARYFQRHDAEEILWHTRQLLTNRPLDTPLVRARLRSDVAGLEVMVWLPKHAGVMARLCSFFLQLNYSVVQAKVYTTPGQRNHHGRLHQQTLATLILLGSYEQGNRRAMLDYIEHDLPGYLQDNSPLPPPPRVRLSRQSQFFPLTPEIRLTSSPDLHTLLVTTADRLGLLYAILRVLDRQHLELESTKVTTLGDRAEDVFTLRGAVDRPLLEKELLAVL